MRYFWVFFLFPLAVFAQPAQIAPHQVYQAISYDFNADDLDDRVLLIADDEYDNKLSLAIYLSGGGGYELAGFAEDLIWIDFYPNEKPWMNADEGEIYINTRFETPGRQLAEEIFMISFLEGEFRLVTYYTYSVDRIDYASERTCSFELGNGVGSRSLPQEDKQETFEHDIPQMTIGNISTDAFLEVCPHQYGE